MSLFNRILGGGLTAPLRLRLTGVALMSIVILLAGAPALAQTTRDDALAGRTAFERQQGWSAAAANAEEPDQTESFEPVDIDDDSDRETVDGNNRQTNGRLSAVVTRPPAPGEFERFAAAMLGRPLPRFGSSLIGDANAFAPATNAVVPPDYRINPGDTISLGLTGSVEGALQLNVDTNGRIFIPRIGAVNVGGVRYGDLPQVLRRAVGREFREFEVAVSVGRLMGLQVYVTGYVASPGTYTVSSLSTVFNAVLAAGGPTAAGSFRTITLQRGGRTVTTLDLYDLLLNGDKSRDVVLQNEDVIHIGRVGDQVAISGSVNYEGIFEVRRGETLQDLIAYAGGPSSLADQDRLLLARVANAGGTGWENISWGQARNTALEAGSIVRVLPAVGFVQPVARQAMLVTIEGEVERPGAYYLQPGARMADLLAQAGPFSPQAYLFGTRISRATIRTQQEASFAQAISYLELALAAAPLSDRRDRRDVGPAYLRIANELLAELRTRRPDGRIVLDISPDGAGLPLDLLLENNDRVQIPARPVTVGVFGAVFQPGSFAEKPGTTIGSYLAKAGGPTRIADQSGVFVVRANGSVVSRQQRGRRNILNEPAIPGDVIFVPVQTRNNSFLDRAMEVATAIYQVSIGAVGLGVLTD